MRKEEKNKLSGVKEIKRKIDNKELDINSLDKENRVFLFLVDSFYIRDKKEIKKIYLEKYNLSERSGDINFRVIERFIGSYSKWSSEKKEERKKVLKEELNKYSIDYNNFIEKVKLLKKKINRSNKLSNELELNF